MRGRLAQGAFLNPNFIDVRPGTQPTPAFDVRFQGAAAATFHDDGSFSVASGAYVSAGGVWTNASSRALKADIRPLSAMEARRLLDVLRHTQVVHFRYRREVDRRAHVGLIAEDAPAELVDPERRGLLTADAIAVLIAAVQAQDARIAELEKRPVARK